MCGVAGETVYLLWEGLEEMLVVGYGGYVCLPSVWDCR
jgi:hypothetical protein